MPRRKAVLYRAVSALRVSFFLPMLRQSGFPLLFFFPSLLDLCAFPSYPHRTPLRHPCVSPIQNQLFSIQKVTCVCFFSEQPGGGGPLTGGGAAASPPPASGGKSRLLRLKACMASSNKPTTPRNKFKNRKKRDLCYVYLATHAPPHKGACSAKSGTPLLMIHS